MLNSRQDQFLDIITSLRDELKEQSKRAEDSERSRALLQQELGQWKAKAKSLATHARSDRDKDNKSKKGDGSASPHSPLSDPTSSAPHSPSAIGATALKATVEFEPASGGQKPPLSPTSHSSTSPASTPASSPPGSRTPSFRRASASPREDRGVMDSPRETEVRSVQLDENNEMCCGSRERRTGLVIFDADKCAVAQLPALSVRSVSGRSGR